MNDLNLCIYSHTDYLDILDIQTYYIKDFKYNLILFLNKNNLDLSTLYSNYSSVIFYDDRKPYASRLIECINKLEKDYFLFVHDNDIILNIDNNIIYKLHKLMIENNIDRIDLKHSPHKLLENNLCFELYDNENKIKFLYNKDPTHYIYNVNPSIYNKKSILNILNKFPNKTYRTIEGLDVQNYCTSFKILETYSDKFLKCGYTNSMNFFKFFHITNGGKLLPLNKNYMAREKSHSYSDIGIEYEKIFKKFNLYNSKRYI